MQRREDDEFTGRMRRPSRKQNQTVRSDTSCKHDRRSENDALKQMAEMWKGLYAAGDIDSPFDREKFEFLAKLFAGTTTGPQKDN
jgi:hypothetical protein